MSHCVGIIVFPDFQILDAGGPIAAFEIAARYRPGAYTVRVLAVAAGPVVSSAGIAMLAEACETAPRLDTVLVMGGDGISEAMRNPALLDFVIVRAGGASRMASVCSGTFVLANAGLLDGRKATTHWGRTEEFARLFPKVRLDADRIFVRDGSLWTSAGITAGIDLALAMIEADLGEGIARKVAQQLVVPYRRLGGQSQFSALTELARPEGRFAALLAWARERLDQPLTVEMLADQAAMSPRHFARAFVAETGTTPAKAIERLRVEGARERVEYSADPLEVIARRAGFGEAERMRQAFLRLFGLSPQNMRRQARQR